MTGSRQWKGFCWKRIGREITKNRESVSKDPSRHTSALQIIINIIIYNISGKEKVKLGKPIRVGESQ